MPDKPKRTNPKPPGRCIFDGRTGLSKEHMWADWLEDYIPRTQTEHNTGLRIIHPDSEEQRFYRRTGDPHARRIRVVCEDCNTGWMSGLQKAVKPYLAPMLLDKPVVLHKRAQRTLASWVATTVMVAEYVNREIIAIPSEDRAYLQENGEPPPHWRIWIGRHIRQSQPMFTHNVLPFASKEEVERLGRGATRSDANTQTTTICLGEHLLIHVMSSRVAWSIIRRWRLPDQVRAGLNQIWPIRASIVRWPTGHTLTDAGVALLADEFFSKAQALVADRNKSA